MTWCGSRDFHVWIPVLHVYSDAECFNSCRNIIRMVLCLWVRPTMTPTTGCGVPSLVIKAKRFAFSHRDHVGFLRVIRFPHAVPKHASRQIVYVKLS